MRTPLIPAVSFLTLLVACVSSDFEPGTDSPNGKPVVLVVHGLGPTRALCAPLGRAIQDEGYRVEVFDYPATTSPVAVGGALLRERMLELDLDPSVSQYHVVTHSMGGIVTRLAIRDGRPEKLGRVVMVAPPNKGSPKAKFFAPAFSWWIEPLSELSSAPDSMVNGLPPIQGVEVGIVAGAADWTVAPEFTPLEGATDFLVLDNGWFATTHNGLVLSNDEARRQILHFIEHGRFDHPIVAETEH